MQEIKDYEGDDEQNLVVREKMRYRGGGGGQVAAANHVGRIQTQLQPID